VAEQNALLTWPPCGAVAPGLAELAARSAAATSSVIFSTGKLVTLYANPCIDWFYEFICSTGK
jgi:hypothetical protein